MPKVMYKAVDAFEVKPEEVSGAKGTTIRWLISRDDGAPNFAMRMFEMQPGGEIPLHDHPWEHEIFILSGNGMVTIGDDEVKVRPNMVIYVPPNVPHSYKNEGEEPLRFLCVIPHHG